MPQGDLTLVVGGAPVQVAATASPGTTIYTAVSGTAQADDIKILASNIDPTTTVDLTFEVAGTSSNNQIWYQLRPKSTVEISILRLNNGAVIKAFASAANKINCYSDANRWTL